jgi:hypothetical protein
MGMEDSPPGYSGLPTAGTGTSISVVVYHRAA